MKRTLLALLLTYVALSFPWRLAALGVEVFTVKPGQTRFTDKNDHYWDALQLELNLIRLGYKVQYVRDLEVHEPGGSHKVDGVTYPALHLIQIEEALSWNARAGILAHEGGHALQPLWVQGEDGESFAETVAALVGGNGLREHARYMSRFKGAFFFIAIAEWRAAYSAAAQLTQ